jgi:PHS family inorganic phosphate transporter-like MFS transporter
MLLQFKLYASEHSHREAIPLEEPAEDEVIVTENSTSVLTNDVEEFDAIIRESEEDFTEQRTGLWESIRREPGLGRKVIGTAGTWFLFDIVFYGNTIFQPIVVEAAFGASESQNPLNLLRETAMDSLILTSIALPGYAVAGMIMGKRTWCVTQTPRYVMLQGFAYMGVLYLAIGVNWSYLRNYPGLLVFLYGMTFFFANYGPNTTTFILPSLLFSPECRSTLNGISAASGKLGALLGATLFEPAAEKWGDSYVMMICGGLAIFAFFLTYFFVPKQEQNRPSHSPEASTNHSQSP